LKRRAKRAQTVVAIAVSAILRVIKRGEKRENMRRQATGRLVQHPKLLRDGILYDATPQ
jgi:hypothetical protein